MFNNFGIYHFRLTRIFLPAMFIVLACSFTNQDDLLHPTSEAGRNENRIPGGALKYKEHPAATENSGPEDTSLVRTEAQFPGGSSGWLRHLSKEIQYPLGAGGKSVQGTVTIKFNVDEKGRLSNIKAVDGPRELTREAVRAIRRSGRWIPAMENGKPVKSEREQSITFRQE